MRGLSDRLWERAPGDGDFLHLRVGTAELPSRTTVKVASGGPRDLRRELEAIPGRFRLLDDVPLSVDLLDIGGVGLAGPMASTRALARSMVVQAATMHSPTDLAVVALVGEGGLTDWTFLKWLPHSPFARRLPAGLDVAPRACHSSTRCCSRGPAAPPGRPCRPCSS